MMCIKERLQLLVLAVYRQGILTQIVRTDAEEINFFRKLRAYQRCRRRFNHNADLHLRVEGYTCIFQLRLHLAQNFTRLTYLFYADNHREHHRQLAICGGTADSTQLRSKQLRSFQADTDCAIAKRRIFLLRQLEVISLLISADIKRTDNNALAGHCFRCQLILFKLLLLGRIILAFQIKELTAEKADALCIVRQYAGQVARAADIGINMHLLTAAGNALFTLELLQQLFMLCILLHLRFNTFQRCFIRINENLAGVAINSYQLAVIFFTDAAAGADNRRNTDSTRQNCRMRIYTACRRHKALYTRFIKLYGFAGCQVIRCQNIAAAAAFPATACITQATKHFVGNILDISSTCTHIIIFHRRKNLSKVGCRCLYRIFCINLLRADNTFNGLNIIKVLQHHLVDFKNSGIIFAYIHNSLFIKLRQLGYSLLTCCLKACNLSLGILNLAALNRSCITAQYSQGSQRYTAANALAL